MVFVLPSRNDKPRAHRNIGIGRIPDCSRIQMIGRVIDNVLGFHLKIICPGAERNSSEPLPINSVCWQNLELLTGKQIMWVILKQGEICSKNRFRIETEFIRKAVDPACKSAARPC